LLHLLSGTWNSHLLLFLFKLVHYIKLHVHVLLIHVCIACVIFCVFFFGVRCGWIPVHLQDRKLPSFKLLYNLLAFQCVILKIFLVLSSYPYTVVLGFFTLLYSPKYWIAIWTPNSFCFWFYYFYQVTTIITRTPSY